jgi:hypothetical protein
MKNNHLVFSFQKILTMAFFSFKISIHINGSDDHESSSGVYPHLVFQVYLNDDYQDGEAKFTNRVDRFSMTMRPDVGSILLFDASIEHELLNSSGNRQYMLSGEISVLLHGQSDDQHTGLSHCAGFLSLPWIRVYLRNVAERKSGILKIVVQKLGSIVEGFTDIWAPHFVANLVDKSDGGKVDDFIVALDKNPIPWIVDSKLKAKWMRNTPVVKVQTWGPNVVDAEF